MKSQVLLRLNDELCMVRPSLINFYPVEVKYYLFSGSPDKCNVSCNCANNLSAETYVPSNAKDINVKEFNIISKII